MRLISRRGLRKPKLPKRRPTTPTPHGAFRPTLQALETRDVPSTLVVTNIGDAGVSGDGSLRGEIAAAQSGDTILFNSQLQGQTITLDGGKGPVHLSTDLTICGLGADKITVSGGNATSVFYIDPGTTDTIAQLTIANGFYGIFNGGTLTVDHTTLSGNIGGISNEGTLTVDHTTLSGNVVDGGIFNSGTLTIDHTTLSGNVVVGNVGGGGIFNTREGTVTVENSTICGNSVEGIEDFGIAMGGGIGNQGKLLIVNSTVSNNSVHSFFDGGLVIGGGILNSGTLTVVNSTLSGNSAREGGGGILNSGTLTVVNSTLTNNSALDNGGGIFNFGTLTVECSTLSGNSAVGYNNYNGFGGGIFNSGTLTVDHTTLSGNSALHDGGGIFNHASTNFNFGTVTVNDSTLSGNSAGRYGGGIYNEGVASSTSGTVTLDQSTLSGNSATSVGGGVWNGGQADHPERKRRVWESCPVRCGPRKLHRRRPEPHPEHLPQRGGEPGRPEPRSDDRHRGRDRHGDNPDHLPQSFAPRPGSVQRPGSCRPAGRTNADRNRRPVRRHEHPVGLGSARRRCGQLDRLPGRGQSRTRLRGLHRLWQFPWLGQLLLRPSSRPWWPHRRRTNSRP